MNWTTWADFAAMGGYGFYVWGSFGAVALVLAWEAASVRARQRALRRGLAPGRRAPFAESRHEA